ncbi:MAG: RNA polymerase primary sigma factor [Parcubacteria group bacterium Gr01-1014_106]|nr:MAG: RNA polymerase primary sigma factor [Parcubacteria group bacterium Gr01-1014_106]
MTEDALHDTLDYAIWKEHHYNTEKKGAIVTKEMTDQEKLMNAIIGQPKDNLLSGDDLKRRIEDLLKNLTYREREVIKLRYGLGDGYAYTLEEVGRIFKVTRERIRQIEAKARKKVQSLSDPRKLEGFLDGHRPR